MGAASFVRECGLIHELTPSLGWQICVAGGDKIVGVALVLFFNDEA